MSNSRQAPGDPRVPFTVVFTAFLSKLAKHLALLACLAIIGQATGRASVGAHFIIGLIVIAALIHNLGATLERRQRHAPKDLPHSS
jgi:hypothetical protein